MGAILVAVKELLASKKAITALVTVLASFICRRCGCDPAWLEQVGIVLLGAQGLADFGKHRKV
mgnify:CR=1 FL=1